MARKKTRKKKPGRRGWKVLAIVLGGSIVAGAWLFWPFWQLAAQFGSHPTVQPSRLYGRPLELAPGSALSAAELAERLEAMGYARREGDGELTPGTFRAARDAVEVFRRTFLTARGPEGGDRLRVGFRGGAVEGVRSDAGGELASARLDPPLVASYYGPELRERRPVGLDEVPEDLVLAVLAAEDDGFLEHPGISLRGVARAAWTNLRAKEVRQGGSTLTQQLVKNLYLTHERTVGRKLREALLAVLLEARYEKREILQAYLNEIYWGRSGKVQLMGVGAAAWAYFGKPPAHLDLAESALLAGMIQAPGELSPRADPEAAKARRDAVLARLVELRWVELERARRAAASELPPSRPPLLARAAPHFAEAVAEEARRRFGVAELADAGYALFSTLDADDQHAAQKAVAWGLEALEDGWEKGRETAVPLEAALVSVDPADGAIRAYVGGRDYGRSQFDRLSQARRQAGSAFKPIVYAAAWSERIAHPATMLEDSPFTVELAGQRWSPRNSDGRYRGWVSARAALEQSLNVPTARLARRVGLEQVAHLAGRAGVGGRLDPYPSLALGAMEVTPLELATVYATFASGGQRPALHGLVAVRDRQDREVAGQPLPAPERVLDADVAYLVTRVLQGVLDRGTARGARSQGITDPLAGKTGTTNERRDSWFAGYSPERASLVWVGYDDNSPTRLSGARAALPIWARFTYAVRPPGGYADFERPPGVVGAWIDPLTGALATDRCPTPLWEHFTADYAPAEVCRDHRGWRALPLDQPELENGGRREAHPFKRWLRMLKQRKNRV